MKICDFDFCAFENVESDAAAKCENDNSIGQLGECQLDNQTIEQLGNLSIGQLDNCH